MVCFVIGVSWDAAPLSNQPDYVSLLSVPSLTVSQAKMGQVLPPGAEYGLQPFLRPFGLSFSTCMWNFTAMICSEFEAFKLASLCFLGRSLLHPPTHPCDLY